QIGAPAEIYERPASSFVAEFIGSSNLLPARVIERGEMAALVETEPGLRLRCAAAGGAGAGSGAGGVGVFRPGRGRVREPGSGGSEENCFPAQIRDVTYLGEDLHLSLELSSGVIVRAAVKNSGGSGWAPDQPVEIAVAAADLRCLRR